jgi:hypothetical protein
MRKNRLEISKAIADEFLPAKFSAVATSAATYRSLATMIEHRPLAMLEPEKAAAILQATREAADAAFVVQAQLFAVHGMLSPIRDAWGIPPGAHGPNDTVKALEPERGELYVVPDQAAA